MSRLSAIIVGTAIALVPPQIAWGGTAAEVNAIAEEIAVRIDGCSVGSGVIFRREGDTYYVLTVNHVVDFKPDFCLVITPDGRRHGTDTAKIKPIEDVDLAVVQFESKNNYRVGKLGNSSEVRRGKTVYVAGTPEPNEVVPEPTLRVTPGVIIGRAKQAPKGYTLIYNNTTRKGMSGGPVLNEAGEIIGIHGRGDREDGSKENYGIPIEKFSEAPASSGSKKTSQSDRNGADESGTDGEGLSWPLMSVFALGILGGSAGIFLGYLYGSRTKRQKNYEIAAKPEERVRRRYDKLRDLLSAGAWKEADIETRKVMLQVADRETEGYFRRQDIENFPCEDMGAIDKLWVKSSNGRFGFSVQKRIWLEEAGKVKYETEKRVADRVGWRVNGEWQIYDNLTFDITAPMGCFPAVGVRGSFIQGQWLGGVLSWVVFSRAQMCEL